MITTSLPKRSAVDQTDAAMRTVLLRQLREQRAHVLHCVAGLDESALRRPVLPSGWTPLGLIRHLTLDDERFWLTAVMAGQPETIEDDAWRVGDDESAESVLELYRAECEQSDIIIESLALDAPPAWWPDGQFGDWRLSSLGEVVAHLLTETAIHAGHLDAARELIDGSQSQVLN